MGQYCLFKIHLLFNKLNFVEFYIEYLLRAFTENADVVLLCLYF